MTSPTTLRYRITDLSDDQAVTTHDPRHHRVGQGNDCISHTKGEDEPNWQAGPDVA